MCRAGLETEIRGSVIQDTIVNIRVVLDMRSDGVLGYPSTSAPSNCQVIVPYSVVPVLADKPVPSDTTSTSQGIPDYCTITTPSTIIVQGRGEHSSSGTELDSELNKQTISTILDSLDTAGKWNYCDGTIVDTKYSSEYGVIQLTRLEQDAEFSRYRELNITHTAPPVGNICKQPTRNILGGAAGQEICEIQRGGWCGVHNCQAKKSYKISAPRWSKNSSGLYNNVRTRSTVWLCPNLGNSNVNLKASQTSSRNIKSTERGQVVQILGERFSDFVCEGDS